MSTRSFTRKKPLAERLGKTMESVLDNSLLKWLHLSPQDHTG